MNELQLKTVQLTPAKIEFNKKAILDELDGTLSKYEDLVFSEENTTEIRRTLAELRKGKSAADKFRIANKKEALKPITDFENDVKEIVKKFDDVIDPIDDQLKEFEENRRAEKLKELEKIRLEHIEEHGLDEEYHDEIEITDSMLTKSMSIRQASESLEFKVKNLKMEQDKKLADKQLIETTVKLANSENDLGFSADAYTRLLDFSTVEEVQGQIGEDVERAVKERKEEQERKEREELERLKKEEQAEFKRSARELKESIEKEEKPSGQHEKTVVDDLPFSDDPFVDFDDPFAEKEIELNFSEKIEAVLKISTTEKNLNELLEYLKEKEIEYEVIDE